MQTSNGVNDPLADRLGLAARAVGILTSPRATSERVAADPRWLGILALGVCTAGLLSAGLMSTEFAQREILDQQARSMEAFGVAMTDEVYEQLAERVQYTAYTTFGSTLIAIPIGLAILAGLLYGAGYGLLGARASFRQVFAVVAHAGVVFRRAGALRHSAQLRARIDLAADHRSRRSRRCSTTTRSSSSC